MPASMVSDDVVDGHEVLSVRAAEPAEVHDAVLQAVVLAYA